MYKENPIIVLLLKHLCMVYLSCILIKSIKNWFSVGKYKNYDSIFPDLKKKIVQCPVFHSFLSMVNVVNTDKNFDFVNKSKQNVN